MATLFLPLSTAYAGNWVVATPVYNVSGSASTSGGATFNNVPPNGIEGGGGQGASITLTGSATIRITWQPTNGDISLDPVPKCVVVSETVSPSAGRKYSMQNVTTTISTGLANNATLRYRVINNPSTTIEINSPNISASVKNGSGPLDYGGLACSFTYSATASTVSVNLLGTTRDSEGQLKVLAGQALTAQLSTPLVQKPGSHQWTIPNTVIKNWSNGVKTDFPAGDKTLAQPTFFPVKRDENLPVSCRAKMIVPAGAVSMGGTGSELDVEAATEAKVIKPEFTGTTWKVLTGNVSMIAPGFVRLTSAPTHRGQDWEATVSAPPPFSNASGGTFNFCQLINTSNVYYTTAALPNNDYVIAGLPQGTFVLDNTFPYSATFGTFGGTIKSGDSPSHGTVEVISGEFVIETVRDDQFQTWLMYRPPSVGNQGTIWVPLAKYAWSWGTTISRNTINSPWQMTRGIVNSGTPTITDEFPLWSNTLTNAGTNPTFVPKTN